MYRRRCLGAARFFTKGAYEPWINVSVIEAHSPNSLCFDSAVAIEELLCGAEGCLVQLLRTFHQSEARTKLFVQGFGVVSDDIETAAFGWAFRPERAHDNMTTRLDGTRDLPNVGGPLFWRGEEMKNSAVMPHVIGRQVKLDLSDICGHPVNSTCDLSQPLLGGVDRYLRNIQDCDVLKSSPRAGHLQVWIHLRLYR